MSNDDQKKKNKKKNSDDGEKAATTKTEERTVLTVVLKIIDIHCEGCATKVKKSIRASEGVASVRGGSTKLTVVGEVDPEKLREMVEDKAKTKVELVSSVATKVKVEVKSNDDAVAVVKAKDKKKSDEKQPEKKPEKKKKPEEDKKSEKPSATTVVMKVDLHCAGCVQKIRKTVSKTKGYQEMSIDEKNNTVTVKGTMDMKALSELLQNQLHKPVEIIPPKKEKTEDKSKGGNKKEANDSIENFAALMEQNRLQYGNLNLNPNPPMYGHEFVYPVGQYHAPPQMFSAPMGQYHAPPPQMFSGQSHAPQMFSDENPNACYIM